MWDAKLSVPPFLSLVNGVGLFSGSKGSSVAVGLGIGRFLG